jgi:hypothetical protein
MKKIILPILSLLFAFGAKAQKDTLISVNQDTIKIGSLLIIKAQKPTDKKDWQSMIEKGDFKNTQIKIEKIKGIKKSRTTKWFAMDLGFANYYDGTNYKYDPSFVRPATGAALSNKSFRLNNSRSSNFNLWIVQQKMNIKQSDFNLKYGIGLQMYNFRFEQPISFRNDGASFVYLDNKTFKKDKLFVNYLTIPVQLNYQPKSGNKKGLNASGGLSFGYLLNSRNKQISGTKEKYNGNFNLNDFQVAGIGEVGVGSLKLYASASLTNLYDSKLSKQFNYPFSIGLRFSNF